MKATQTTQVPLMHLHVINFTVSVSHTCTPSYKYPKAPEVKLKIVVPNSVDHYLQLNFGCFKKAITIQDIIGIAKHSSSTVVSSYIMLRKLTRAFVASRLMCDIVQKHY